MKTLINTVLKSSSVAILLVASLFSLDASAATVTADRGAVNTDIKRVVVTGNTKVILIQSAAESVTVDESDLAKISMKQLGNTLTIGSSEDYPVTVTVYVKNIYRIDASGKANVSTAGTFNLQMLQVLLKDDATARVKAKTEGIYTVINDRAKLQLIGTSDQHIAEIADLATIDTNKFSALKTEGMKTATGVTASAQQIQTAVLSK